MTNQFSNISCYEEFEIQCTLNGISKIDILKEIGHKVNDYYFFISEDGIINWYNLEGNYVKDPGILKELKEEHIPENITKCVIPNSVKIIDFKAFAYCDSLTSITIPSNVKIINAYAFWFCESLKEITIPDSVTGIGYKAFSCCESLKEITIPDSVINIECEAFWLCESLKEIIFKGKTLEQVKQMENYPFGIEDESIIKCEI